MIILDKQNNKKYFIEDSILPVLRDLKVRDGVSGPIFFARQLEALKVKSYDVKYPDLQFRKLFPVSNEAGPGADSIVYVTYDQKGIAQIIASGYAKDIPRADVGGKETIIPVRELGISIGYTRAEIRKAQRAGLALSQRKMNAADRGNEQTLNLLAFYGDDDANLLGLFNHPNLTVSVLPDGAGGDPEWSTKTPAEILKDMNAVVNDVNTDTNLVERVNTLLLPVEQFNYINSTYSSDTRETTILEAFVKNNTFIKTKEDVIPVNEMKAAGTAGANVMVAYDRNIDTVSMEIPMEKTFGPEERRGLEILVISETSTGALNVIYPGAFNLAEGL